MSKKQVPLVTEVRCWNCGYVRQRPIGTVGGRQTYVGPDVSPPCPRCDARGMVLSKEDKAAVADGRKRLY